MSISKTALGIEKQSFLFQQQNIDNIDNIDNADNIDNGIQYQGSQEIGLALPLFYTLKRRWFQQLLNQWST